MLIIIIITCFSQMHEMEADFEQQKMELQKLHSQNIREIVTDTDERLKRMESEYSQQDSTTVINWLILQWNLERKTPGNKDRCLMMTTRGQDKSFKSHVE